jgi:DNA polymerase-3 subunit alpha
VDLRRVNKRVVESLIKSGAFDSTVEKRAAMIGGLEHAMDFGQKIQRERESAQVSLFGTAEIVRGNGNGGGQLPDLPEWTSRELLAFEKEAIGFYISGHPLDRYGEEIKKFGAVNTADLSERPDKSDVKLCGIVASLTEKMTKRGDRMAFFSLEDRTGSVEVMVFPDTFAGASAAIKADEPILVSGTVEVGEENCKVKATEIVLLRDANARQTTKVHVTLKEELGRTHLETLHELLGRYPGGCRTFIHFQLAGFRKGVMPLPALSVAASEDLSVEVERLFGYNAVRFE